MKDTSKTSLHRGHNEGNISSAHRRAVGGSATALNGIAGMIAEKDTRARDITLNASSGPLVDAKFVRLCLMLSTSRSFRMA